MKFNKKFEDAKDQHVAVTVLYGDGSALYADEAKTQKVAHDDALDLCFKGVVIYDLTDQAYYSVVSFKDAAGTLTVTDSDDNAYSISASA